MAQGYACTINGWFTLASQLPTVVNLHGDTKATVYSVKPTSAVQKQNCVSPWQQDLYHVY